MVIRHLIGALLLLLSASGLDAAPAVLDFSRSHTIEDVRRSGLKIKLLTGYKGSHLAYVFEEESDIVVILPGGRKISQKITIALIDAKNGILTHLDLRGGVMPQDQAYEVAGNFCDSFNLPREKLESWYQRNLGQQYSVDRLGLSPNASYYPRVTLGVSAGYSKLYPWCVSLLVTWNWNVHRGWDEGRAWREFPEPSIPEISLNPPSGLKYDVADDFKPFVETLKAAFGQSKKTQVQGSGYNGGTTAPPGDVVPKAPADPVDRGDRWWFWISGAVLLLTVLWYASAAYRRKD